MADLDILNKVKFDSNGLVPVITTDYSSKEVLMLAYFNRQSLEQTMQTGIVCYYSRSRQQLWVKGATSSNYQKLRSISLDCDADTILLQVDQLGPACHTGVKSCFFNNLPINADIANGFARQKVAVFGSTGSIGKSSMDVLLECKDSFEIVLLTCESNYQLLLQQASVLRPSFILIEAPLQPLVRQQIINEASQFNTKVIFGSITEPETLLNLKQIDFNTAILAVPGFRAVRHLAAIFENKNITKICLANKESIVCLGDLLFKMAAQRCVEIVPVDSEHNSVFSILGGFKTSGVESLVITASGGALLNVLEADLGKVAVKDVMRHPNWNMGAKITLDSSTLANKGLELIEACRLFNLDESKIEVYINRTSHLHGGVRFLDGSFVSFTSKPRMQTHIARALFYPFESGYRQAIGDKSLDLCNQLNFILEPVDYKRFDLLQLAREVSFSVKLSMAYNMFNELAASKFFNGDLQFAAIAPYVRSNIESLKQKLSTADLKSSFETLEEVFEFYNTLGTFQS